MNLLLEFSPISRHDGDALLHPFSRLCFCRFGAPFPSSRAWEPNSPFFGIRFFSRYCSLSMRMGVGSNRSCLPFPPKKEKFHGELETAVVERACRLCLDVKHSLISSDSSRILGKNDQTPVTVADFGVQALISLELGRLFPSIPLVAEEDSSFLRSNSVNLEKGGGHLLLDSVHKAVDDNTRGCDEPLTSDDVLEAIDRGGKNTDPYDILGWSFSFCRRRNCLWNNGLSKLEGGGPF